MKHVKVYISRNETKMVEFKKDRRVDDAKSIEVLSDQAAEVWHVKFHSPLNVDLGPDHPSDFNNTFPLRFYLPKTKASQLFIFINGFGEGKTKVWDHLGFTFAKEGVASVLVPLPQHFCRNILFNIDDYDEDSYRLKVATELELYNNSLRFGFLAHPKMLIEYNRQMMADIEKLVRCIMGRTGAGDYHLEDFIKEHFESGTRCSILGFSLGGLVALQAFLNATDSYNSCVIVNSGASFQDMNASQVFKDDWRDLQRGILEKTRDMGRNQMPYNFDRVFLGHEKVALHDQLMDHQNKILLLLGGSDPIFNRANIVNIVPERTGLAMFQIPGLHHFINIPSLGGDVWNEWTRFTAKMILAFDQFRP
jgi:hypothetical protein